MTAGDHPSGQRGPMPEDPFPDLTLVRLEDLRLSDQLAYLKVVQDLFPGPSIVLVAEVLDRTAEGAPRLVRIIP